MKLLKYAPVLFTLLVGVTATAHATTDFVCPTPDQITVVWPPIPPLNASAWLASKMSSSIGGGVGFGGATVGTFIEEQHDNVMVNGKPGYICIYQSSPYTSVNELHARINDLPATDRYLVDFLNGKGVNIGSVAYQRAS
jgi:hypothetical protein